MKYQVEVTEPLPPDLEIVAERVASMFGIKSAKIRALLERAPGVVTKLISECEATMVIDAFTQTGIWARLLPFEADTPSRLDHHSDTAGNDFADLTEPEPGPEPVLVVPDEPGVDHDSATPPYDYDQESEPPAERRGRSAFLSQVNEPELARAEPDVPLFPQGATDPNGPPPSFASGPQPTTSLPEPVGTAPHNPGRGVAGCASRYCWQASFQPC